MSSYGALGFPAQGYQGSARSGWVVKERTHRGLFAIDSGSGSRSSAGLGQRDNIVNEQQPSATLDFLGMPVLAPPQFLGRDCSLVRPSTTIRAGDEHIRAVLHHEK